ncbi:MAG: hypothetical protein ACLP01_24560 [Solirubrobacteraceae bacterium]
MSAAEVSLTSARVKRPIRLARAQRRQTLINRKVARVDQPIARDHDPGQLEVVIASDA